jgi:tRNA(Arg) A34 adenosine deaminase TadA
MSEISGSWKRGFAVAEASSRLSNGPQRGYMLGAALYAGSNLLSVGCNNWYKSNPLSKVGNWQGNTHAEMVAILRRRHFDHNRNLTLYVSRTTTNSRQTKDKPGCSRPCKLCMGLIKISGIKRVRFYDEDGNPAEIKL